jgi:endoglucanase
VSHSAAEARAAVVLRRLVAGSGWAGLVTMTLLLLAPDRARADVLVPTTGTAGNPFAGMRQYVDPASPASQTEQRWRAAGRFADADTIARIANHPHATWLGEWSGRGASLMTSVRAAAAPARAAGALPLLVAYDLPWRDCGGHSLGGAAGRAAYRRWITALHDALSGGPAAVILEPDALAELSCLSPRRRRAYYSLLRFAVTTLSSGSRISVYLDAGHRGWQSAAEMARRLSAAGIAHAQGFALNVSNFDSTPSEAAYGAAISLRLGGRHFVIDTSRNGLGSAPGGAWCNPPGRGLGLSPRADTGLASVDAFLWVKPPGESDGRCRRGPNAGVWWARYALGLARRAAL